MACNRSGAVCNRCGRALTAGGAARAGGAGRTGGCPRRRGGVSQALAATAAKAAADAAGAAVLNAQAADCAGSTSLPNAAVLYGAPERVAATCADCYDRYGSHSCSMQNRNAFWPRFAHPRWLTCQQLYNCRNRRR